MKLTMPGAVAAKLEWEFSVTDCMVFTGPNFGFRV